MGVNTAGVYRVETDASDGEVEFVIRVRRTPDFTMTPAMELPADVRASLIKWLDAQPIVRTDAEGNRD